MLRAESSSPHAQIMGGNMSTAIDDAKDNVEAANTANTAEQTRDYLIKAVESLANAAS